jgi:hypothetical protein
MRLDSLVQSAIAQHRSSRVGQEGSEAGSRYGSSLQTILAVSPPIMGAFVSGTSPLDGPDSARVGPTPTHVTASRQIQRRAPDAHKSRSDVAAIRPSAGGKALCRECIIRVRFSVRVRPREKSRFPQPAVFTALLSRDALGPRHAIWSPTRTPSLANPTIRAPNEQGPPVSTDGPCLNRDGLSNPS